LGKGDGVVKGEGKIKHRSLGSRPGRGKRREREVRGEKERFEVNMARMLGGGGGEVKVDSDGGGAGNGKGVDRDKIGGRWKALRGFIEQTMEKKEDFES
jgi:hypothetical protein